MTSETTSLFSILINTAGGVGLFLLGMQQLSDGLQAVAGQRVRKLIAAATDNRLVGILTGTVVTGIIQSSSIVTVMVVGFVTAGIMTLSQAINVIIGANIGTTATAWIVAFAPVGIGTQAMVIIAIASGFYLFAKNEKLRYSGLACLGVGIIFFSLELMSAGLKPLADDPRFIDWFHMFHADTYRGLLKCVLIGTIVTGIIQSSSAATAISITLAVNGALSFETAGALVFGMNIGTTVTAWIAATTATTAARRAALAHTLFNVIGVILIIPFYVDFVVPAFHHIYPNLATPTTAADGTKLFLHVATPIAMVHSMFNIASTLLFLPFTQTFAKLVTKLLPSKLGPETPHLQMPDPSRTAPVIAVEQARKQVEYMANCNLEILGELRTIITGAVTEDLEQHIFNTEDKLDRIQHEVSIFLGKIITRSLPTDVAQRARMLLRVADEVESISDEVASLVKVMQRMRNNEMKLTDKGRQEMLELHDLCAKFAERVTNAFLQGKARAVGILIHMRVEEEVIRRGWL